MDSKNIQTMIETMKQELIDLKTIQGNLRYCTGYTYTYTHTGSSQTNQIFEVTYEDADTPVFSEALGSNFAAALEISGNKQRFFFRLLFANQKITFSSNKKITNVSKLT